MSTKLTVLARLLYNKRNRISCAGPQKLRFENSTNKKKRKRGFFILYERGLAALILRSSALKINKRNISNTQNKKASSFILSLLCFNFFVDLFVTQRGFDLNRFLGQNSTNSTFFNPFYG